MKLVSESLENKKAFLERQNILEREKNHNQKIVEAEAEKYLEEKYKLEEQIENIQQTIWEDIQDQKDKIEDSLSGHLKHREEKNQIKEQEKTIRQLEEKLEKTNKDYKLLQNLFELKEGEKSSEKMKKLLQDNERNKQLKIIYFEKKNRLEELQRELMKVKEENEREIQKELKKMGNNKHEKKERESKENYQDRKLEIMLDNLCLKLGVHDKKDIVKVLQRKMAEKGRVEVN